MSYECAKFKENPCVGADASTPLISNKITLNFRKATLSVSLCCTVNKRELVGGGGIKHFQSCFPYCIYFLY